nr:hypothetical protein [Streptococcus gallolyticus]
MKKSILLSWWLALLPFTAQKKDHQIKLADILNVINVSLGKWLCLK